MSSIQLSICIPTYNRCTYLKENIVGILSQVTPELSAVVEICISDNASLDDTETVVAQLIKDNPSISIKYARSDVNKGADWNFHRAMVLAGGKYSWLLGDDDALAEGAVRRILELIATRPEIGVFAFNRIRCDIDMNETGMEKFVRDDVPSFLVDFTLPLTEKYYYTLCRSLGGIMSFISSVVYNTDSVRDTKFDESLSGTAYTHLFYWFSYLKSGKKLLYVDEYPIKCRIGLPSFGSGYKRIILDLKGMLFLKDRIFVNDQAVIEFLAILKYEWPIRTLLYNYCVMLPEQWDIELRPLLKKVGWSENELSLIEKIGDTPNLFQSRFKTRLSKTLSKFKGRK
ncbi:glycosyltransferase family 2 protein [Hufsiella ginkgonis]|uniref:Glycosyltransferase n=1 Tax=Hufsiella ginkgonis TaxID=2695274 RepID=A0A7K1Y402_9SPHI|nr:glycosyltransferase family 2 protein [Hufsiella ginkgonis]MXV17426.1 glycosyltransferase [Hufsiella ginkgonis]